MNPGRRNCTVLALACALALPPAQARAQTPNLSTPSFLPGTALIGPASGTQRAPALARGASSSLLVFEDNRAGDYDLFGLRLDANGQPLDAMPFSITRAPGDQTAPHVAWNGQSWLVTFKNQVPSPFGYFQFQVSGQRVAASGALLDSEPIALASDDTGNYYDVTSDGQNWLVAYTGFTAGNSGIWAKRIAPDGHVLDPAGVLVQPAAYYIYFGLAATWAQGEFLLSWQGASSIELRRFSSALAALDPAPVALPMAQATISGGLDSFLVSWLQQTPQFTMEVVGRRLGLGLQALDAQPFAISNGSSAVAAKPVASFDGSQWIVAWLVNGTQGARAARVSTSGLVLDAGGVELPDGSPSYLYGASLGALAGGGALLAWDDPRYGSSSDVFGTSLSGAGAAGAEQLFSRSPEAQRNPRIAVGDGQSLLVYRADLGNGSRVLAQRVDRLGGALDQEPLEVAAAAHQSLYAGGAAWNGSYYLVAWSDGQQGRIFARRLGADGLWLDAAPTFVLLGGGADVAALGADFLVTGLRAPSYPQFVYSYGARVRGSDGVVLDDPALLIGSSYAARARAVALGGRWLVVTESHWSHDENPANALLHFVDPNGLVSAAGSTGMYNIQTQWGIVDVASSGSSALIVAQSGSNWTNVDVFAQRVLPDGALSAPQVNVTASVGRGQWRPTVAWTGSEYVVAHESFQNNAWSYDFEPDLYAARLSEGGQLLDSTAFALWSGEDYEQQIDAAGLSAGKALFACSAYDEQLGALRVALRMLRPDGLTNFGTGTSGCAGAQHMDANGEPFGGNAGFELVCDHAPAGSVGVLGLSSAADIGGTDPFALGVLLHLGMPPAHALLSFGFAVDAQGLARRQLPVPADSALWGLTLYAQGLFAWSGGCNPSALGLSSSDGLALAIQQP